MVVATLLILAHRPTPDEVTSTDHTVDQAVDQSNDQTEDQVGEQASDQGAISVESVGEQRKKFSCMFCERTFARKRYVNLHHRRIHSGERQKRFQCRECLKCFAENEYYTSHFKRCHFGLPYPCTVGSCPATFARIHDQKQHMIKSHFDKLDQKSNR
ncbi:hypothetical protein GPALN_014159 [Globodera pallida]|nr:hypothetical protein GPALN_014159 [Globodera pallida]